VQESENIENLQPTAFHAKDFARKIFGVNRRSAKLKQLSKSLSHLKVTISTQYYIVFFCKNFIFIIIPLRFFGSQNPFFRKKLQVSHHHLTWLVG